MLTLFQSAILERLSLRIRLAITELNQRGDTSDSAAVVRDVMLFSAFTLSRQIPLHLLLVSAVLDPIETARRNWEGQLLIWKDPRLPIGEIQRELERNSLVKRDEPLRLCPEHGGGRDVFGAASATIAVNEIVQRLIREDVEKNNQTNQLLCQLAYHVQSWVQFFLGSGLHCGREFLPHAFAIAEYALKNKIANLFTALLWGNAASVHMFDERYDAAEKYLSAELEYLRTNGTNPVVEIQAALALAEVLRRNPDSFATSTERALQLIGRATALISKANPDDPTTLIEQVWAARGILAQIRSTRRHDEECLRLQSALEAYTDMLPRLAAAPLNALMLEIGQHLFNNEPEAAKTKALALLEHESITQLNQPQLLRFVATACAHLQEWVETLQYIRKFSTLIRSRDMSYQDISSLAIDVGLSCFNAIVAPGDIEAIVVLRSLLRLVDQYELHRRPFHNADAACVLALRALREATRNSLDLRDHYLGQADFSDLRAQNPSRAVAWEMMSQIINNVRVSEPFTDALLDALPISSRNVEEVLQEPIFESQDWSGPTYDEERGTISVATNPLGKEALWRLHSADQDRVEGGLIIGPRGSGKTAILQTIAREVAYVKELSIWFADPSGRHESSSGFMSKTDRIGFDSNEARHILITASEVARARREECTPYLLSDEKRGGIIVFLEEGQVVMDPNDSELMDAVEYLVTEGPAGGVGLIVTVPDTDLASFGGHRNVRNSLSAVNTIVLRPEWGGPGFIDNLQ